MDYPNELIRGIKSKDHIYDDGMVSTALFYFEDKDQREDGALEMSINWLDDEEALGFTMQQCKDTGEILFKAGAAILSRESFDSIAKAHPVAGKLFYERKPIEGVNKYHGNIILSEKLPKRIRTLIANSIALLCVVDVLRQE